MSKNILKGLSLPALALAALVASCQTDDDSNPTMLHPASFVLNTPAYAQGNTYDLSRSETVTLTASQPDYGYPAVTVYEVQVSLTESFAEGTWTTLDATHTSAVINVDGVELNNAVVRLYQNTNGGADPSGIVMPVYIRLRAHVSGTDDTYCLSNVIALQQVVVSYVATVPSAIYLGGGSIHGGASGKALAPVYGLDGQYYAMAYLASGSTFFWGDSADSQANGYAMTASVTDNAGAGVSQGADGGIMVSAGGWYVILMTVAVEANALVANITLHPASAHLIGAVAGDEWNDADANWALVPGATANEEWVSPPFGGTGELRAYIHVPGIDWWRTEFTLYNGNLHWRAVDIPDNWADNVGEAYSVPCTTGGRLHVDFDYDTGYVTDN